MAVIASRIGLAPDEAGDSPGAALPRSVPFSFQGTVGYQGDADVYSFTANAGTRLSLNLKLTDAFGAQQRSNLDAEMALLDSSGAVLQHWTNDNGLLAGTFKTDPLPTTVRTHCKVFELTPDEAL